ncbi:MAG: hypothetical protein CO028_02665 [Candidatus Levybacteria bacterium CG_4_9_14_0_2_um_filter_35_21]|nr:MAG: hypothetical protein CO028_02665 [Candidatus Levybacteria bacterium CG_4_9_14_0_2_um_filter_35_21]
MYKKKLKTQRKNKALPMDKLKTWFNNLLQKVKGEDNYLTTETFTAGAAVLIVIIIIVTLLISPASFKKSGSRTIVPTVIPTLTPTPTPIPLPRGPREFGISGGVNPQFRDLKFSEYDPTIGQSQTITASVLDVQGNVKSVEIKLITDSKSKTYPMKLSEGTVKKGVWSITIITEDKHDYIYRLIIKAKNDKGQESTVNPIFK